ncbi:MAG: GNAT family N-acetyltransferase [Peptostreptococcaceae bacterium]
MLYESELNVNIKKLLYKDLISNLNIIGILENQENTKIYVDDINYPTGIVVNIGYLNYMYTENEKFTDKVIDYISNNKGEYGFSGVKSEIAKKIQSRFKVEWKNPCTLYYYDNNKYIRSSIKDNVCSLSVDYAEIVNNYYTFKDEDSLFEIKESILNRVSKCVFKEGELASWLLIHKDNSLGPMFTREEYRKEGYAVDITLSLVDEILDQGKIPYLQVEKGNYASEKLAEKCGFKQYGNCEWFGIRV